jgi:hypothetical protein
MTVLTQSKGSRHGTMVPLRYFSAPQHTKSSHVPYCGFASGRRELSVMCVDFCVSEEGGRHFALCDSINV